MAGPDRVYIHDGHRVAARPDRDSEIWDMTEERGLPLDLIKKDRPIKAMALHHGMKSPQETQQVLKKRGVSSHMSVAKNRIYQHGDLADMSEATGGANYETISLDIAQDTNPDLLDWHRNVQGLDIEVIDHPAWDQRSWAGTGARRRILSLDKRTLNSTVDAMLDAHELFGIPLRVPTEADGSLRYRPWTPEERDRFLDEGGFFPHFLSSDSKWDPPWWPEIVAELFRRVGTTPESGSGKGLTTVGKPKPPGGGPSVQAGGDMLKVVAILIALSSVLAGGATLATAGGVYLWRKRKRRRRR